MSHAATEQQVGTAGCDAPNPRDVVFTFFIETWTGAVRREMARPPDRLIQTMLLHPAVRRLLVVSAYRGIAVRAMRTLGLRGGMPPFPDGGHNAELISPTRLRRREPTSAGGLLRSCRSYDATMRRAATRFRLERPALITTNPFVAAFSPLEWAHSITYYARDDWAAHHDHAVRHVALQLAYREIAARGVRVCAVSHTLLDRIAPTGPGLAVPNGVDPEEWRSPPPPPRWFEALPAPRIVYAGVLDERIDVDAVADVANRLRDGSVVLAGTLRDATHLAPLQTIPRVHFAGHLERRDVVGVVHASDACIIPHRRNRLTEAMSPLKLYEYLAAGRPVVAPDLEPARGVHPKVVLVPDGGSFGERVGDAIDLGPMTEEERRQFIDANTWRARHERILQLALC